jgi:nitrite reductase (NADH) large subunit
VIAETRPAHSPSKGLLFVSLLGLGLVAGTVIAAFSPGREVHGVLRPINWLWENSARQQISGYALLAVCVFSLAFSVRKRWGSKGWGHLGAWRLGHAIAGLLTLPLFIVHTGLHTGSGLNAKLWLLFMTVLFFGGLSGVVVAVEGHRGKAGPSRYRVTAGFAHLVAFWLFVSLTFFHILSVYYF